MSSPYYRQRVKHGKATSLTGNDIVSIVNDGLGRILMTTGAAHGLEPLTDIVLHDTGNLDYDELTVTVEEVPTPTTAIMTDESYLGDAFQGTWELSGA